MRTHIFYQLILFVYVLLWSCQLVACHLTHSLIILTDSYINLYRILDISLGILHLRAQRDVAEIRAKRLAGGQTGSVDDATKASSANKTRSIETLAGRVFDSTCTYQYKRLPLLGSFINGLFLAALLMSAAIEGIQTCFHSGHSPGHNEKTILNQNPLTYPLVLAGFALVGLVMQHCSIKAHEMREEELCSESSLDLSRIGQPAARATPSGSPVTVIRELDANRLAGQQQQLSHLTSKSKKRQSYDLIVGDGGGGRSNGGSNSSHQGLPLTIRANEIASNERETQISLKSLRFSENLEALIPLESVSGDLESASRKTTPDRLATYLKQTRKLKASLNRDNWFWVRYLASPVALVTWASMVYLVKDELAIEVADAALAVTVVVLLFAASYPPMKKAGKILLQTAPDGVNLSQLREELATSSGGKILLVKDLHVWSLTPRSNRVATCRLVLDKDQITTEAEIQQIISEAKFKFLDQNIRCTTIEPVLADKNQPKAWANQPTTTDH